MPDNVPDTSNSYLEGLRKCIAEIEMQNPKAIADIIFQAYLKAKHIYIFGNGGSAATASHFARDLSVGSASPGKPRVKAISLADNMVGVTSIANDINYESIFVEQMTERVEPGDVAIAISCSGDSPNVLRAIEYAKERGATTIGFTGFGGGKLRQLADLSINLSSRNHGQIEDMHLALEHIVSNMLREKLKVL
jgi:D-sedoheptulose 7-phosphate isomerase